MVTHGHSKARRKREEALCDFFFLKEERKKVKLWRECVCVKTHLMEGLHFGFQMCELSCCLSLRWSLLVCLLGQSLSMQLLISSDSHQC